jgi:hypothetical protein
MLLPKPAVTDGLSFDAWLSAVVQVDNTIARSPTFGVSYTAPGGEQRFRTFTYMVLLGGSWQALGEGLASAAARWAGPVQLVWKVRPEERGRDTLYARIAVVPTELAELEQAP